MWDRAFVRTVASKRVGGAGRTFWEFLFAAAGRRLGQRQAERLQILRREAGRNFAACEKIHAPQAEEIFLFFTGEAHRSFSLYRHGPAWSVQSRCRSVSRHPRVSLRVPEDGGTRRQRLIPPPSAPQRNRPAPPARS